MPKRAGAMAPASSTLEDSALEGAKENDGEVVSNARHFSEMRPIRLTRPHGFVDVDGRRHHWAAGHVASEPGEIALLVGRGATHVTE